MPRIASEPAIRLPSRHASGPSPNSSITGGDHQLDELRMLGVRIVSERCADVVLAGGRADPGDHARGVDVVDLVEDQQVILAGRAGLVTWFSEPGDASPERQQRDDDQQRDRQRKVAPGNERASGATVTRRAIHSGAVEFEKWQALGNDYVILERDQLAFELTPARIRAICAAHTGVSSDGILLLSRTDRARLRRAMRIFNPDGSESNLSGNGAREAVLYLRRAGWTDAERFSLLTEAGEIRAQVTVAEQLRDRDGHRRRSQRRLSGRRR